MKRSMIWLAVAAAGCTGTGKVHGAVDDASSSATVTSQTIATQQKNNPQQNNLRMETIIVSAPLHKSAAETALPVTVIGGDELQQRGAASIGATLDSSPGLANASFGPGVGQPVIRGQQGPRVQVLENSVSSGDASSVSADHAVTVEPMLAESIEVLRGPSTLLYGGGAIGGVVNVIDNRIPKKAVVGGIVPGVTGAVEYRHDSNNDGDTTVFKLDGSNDVIGWHLDGVYRDWNDSDIPGLAFNRDHVGDLSDSSDGHIANTAGRNHNITGGTSWLFDSGYVGVSVSDMSNLYGIPTVAGGESGIHIDMRQKRYDVAGEWDNLNAVIDALRWRLTYTDYEHKELEDTGEVGTQFTNETWQSRLELVHEEVAGWHGVVGVQLKRSDFAAVGEESFIPESISKGVGVFVVEDYHLDPLIFEFGLRYDRDEIDPDSTLVSSKTFDNASASGGVIWQFAPSWNLGLALSRSQRAPTVEELFSNAGNDAADLVVHGATQSIEVGDAKLDAETSQNVDLTLSHKDERFDGYFTLFHNQFSDFIFLANTGATDADGVPVLNYSQEDAEFYGAEFNLTTQLGQLSLGKNALGKFSVDLYGDSVRGELDNSGAVPRMPPWRIGTRVHWDLKQWSGYAGVLHAGDQNRAGEFENDTDGYTRLDAGLSYALALFGGSGEGGDNSRGGTNAQLFLRGNNLTNQTIRASTSFLRDYAPEPGRSVEAGVRLSF
jgi:iron complex outermembrane receptor protein